MEWLDESERNLDSEVEIANEPDKIKTQLTQHKVIKTLFPQYHVPLVKSFPFFLVCFICLSDCKTTSSFVQLDGRNVMVDYE